MHFHAIHQSIDCRLIFGIGNGYITTAVLREILKELDDKITNEDLDMMIEEIDSDGSGTVDFDGNIFVVLKWNAFSINRFYSIAHIFLLSTEFMEVMTGGDDWGVYIAFFKTNSYNL